MDVLNYLVITVVLVPKMTEVPDTGALHLCLCLWPGAACEIPANPAHGKYECEDQMCTLVCSPGHVLPLSTSKEQQMLPVHDRATHVCTDQEGTSVWEPKHFYDCIVKMEPSYFKFLIPMSIWPRRRCTPNDTDADNKFSEKMKRQALKGNTNTLCYKEINAVCYWNVTARCEGGKWEMDVIMKIIFNADKVEDIRNYIQHVYKWIYMDRYDAFSISRQRETTDVSSLSTFFECPPATRIDRDFLCHGCSPGFYLDGSQGLCVPCPVGFYQDQSLQVTCKRCPVDGEGLETGVGDIRRCYKSDQWIRHPDIVTTLATLFAVAGVTTVAMLYRKRVKKEPSGQSPETYDFEMIPESDSDTSEGMAQVTDDDGDDELHNGVDEEHDWEWELANYGTLID